MCYQREVAIKEFVHSSCVTTLHHGSQVIQKVNNSRTFGVRVTGVWTSQQRGKPRRVGTSAGLRPRWKKAIVTLKAGDSIEIFEG